MGSYGIILAGSIVALVFFLAGTQEAAAESTRLYMERLPRVAYLGTSIEFSGQLVNSNGYGISHALIYIKENDPGFDDKITTTRTDSSGYFSKSVTVKAWDSITESSEIYAVFEGRGGYDKSRSSEYSVRIVSYGGAITLDPLPREARTGDIQTISGTLRLDGKSVQGKVVYIKDNDRFTRDELLATAYVDSSGRFEAHWRVVNTDEDDTIDIFAVYEGDSTHKRLATCTNLTCSDTIPLRILKYIPPTPPIISDNAYMKLYHSLRFTSSPYVAIVPSADNYQEVRNHIYPVTEGINNLGEYMRQNHGGDWSVEFDLVTPGETFNRNPDIIINLITPDDGNAVLKEVCKDWSGLAYPSTKKPINTYVCAKDEYGIRSNADVSRTSMHEFIHAIGVGHTFGILKQGDLMCSREDGTKTCKYKGSKSYVPSKLNRDAIARLYGSDGYKTPNYAVTYEQKFYSDTDRNGGAPTKPSPIPIPITIKPAVPGCQSTDDRYDFNIDNYRLDPKMYSWWTLCTDKIIEYHFSTHSNSGGFTIFVLPPETDPNSFANDRDANPFANDRDGGYYKCERYGVPWTSKTGDCNIEPGSNIMLYNHGTDTISVNGWIKTVDDCKHTDYAYNNDIDTTIKPSGLRWWSLCIDETVEYHFTTGNSNDGFQIFILPPETSTRAFIYERVGNYYECEEYEQGWITKSGSCKIEPGSKIVLYNYESNTINIDGWIRTR